MCLSPVYTGNQSAPWFTWIIFFQLLRFSHIKFLKRRLILVGSIQNFGFSPTCFLYFLFVFRIILPQTSFMCFN